MRGMTIMSEQPSAKKVAARKLMMACFFEALAIVAGLIAFSLTGSWVWIAIGVLGGLGFSLPAVIVFIRASMEERDRASR